MGTPQCLSIKFNLIYFGFSEYNLNYYTHIIK